MCVRPAEDVTPRALARAHKSPAPRALIGQWLGDDIVSFLENWNQCDFDRVTSKHVTWMWNFKHGEHRFEPWNVSNDRLIESIHHNTKIIGLIFLETNLLKIKK